MFEGWALGIRKCNTYPKKTTKNGKSFQNLNLVNLLPDHRSLNRRTLEKNIKIKFSLKPKITFNKMLYIKNQKKLIEFYNKIS